MPVPQLSITLSSTSESWRVGDLIQVGVEVRNISKAPVWAIGVLDGSESGFRYPHYLPLITGPKPLPATEEAPWCGNVSPLLLSDFRQLLPGEGFDPGKPAGDAVGLPLVAFQNFRPATPGHYQLSVIYDSSCESDREWLGMTGYPGEDRVLQQLTLVPRLLMRSNLLTLKVT